MITSYQVGIILNNLLNSPACPIRQAITGAVYPDERPESTLEDLVYNVISIDSGQTQQAVANVNIYVPDIKVSSKGRYVADLKRLDELTQKALETLEEVDDPQYTLWVEDQHTYDEPETKMHYSNLRIQFRYFNA